MSFLPEHSNLDKLLDKWLRMRSRGILSPREVVDFAFAQLAYEGRSDLVESLVKRLLQERLGDEIKSWVEWDGEHPSKNYHHMPFNDSRLIIYHFGEPDDSTPEQQESLRAELRFRINHIAAMVRTILNELGQGCQK